MDELYLNEKIENLIKSFGKCDKDKENLNICLIELEKLHEQQILEYGSYIKGIKLIYNKQIIKISNENQDILKEVDRLKQNNYDLQKNLNKYKNIFENNDYTRYNNLNNILTQADEEKIKLKEHLLKLENVAKEVKDNLDKCSNKLIIRDNKILELEGHINNLESNIKKINADNAELLQNNQKLKLIHQNNSICFKNFEIELQNKFKFKLDLLQSENKELKKGMIKKDILIENQKNLWNQESKKLETTLEQIYIDKENLKQITTNSILNDKKKLYGVIQGLHAKLLQTKLEKQKQFSNLKSQAQINLKKSFKKVENLTEENSALRNDLNELQKKLAHLIANNNVLNQEYDKSMRNTENDLHMILESKDTHIRKLTQDVLNLQNELKIKGCEYKKKKQIYCKIIVKLRNQLKLINGNVFDKLKDASDKNFCFSKEEMEPYLKSMKNLKFDEIPIGNEILHKLPKL